MMQKTPGEDTSGEPDAADPVKSLLPENNKPVTITLKPPPPVEHITASALNAKFSRTLDRVRSEKVILVVTSYGKEMGVLVPPGVSDLIEEIKIVMRIAEARLKIRELLCCAQYLDQSFIIERLGEPVAAVVPMKILDIMAEIDIMAALRAETERKPGTSEEQAK